MHVYNNAEKALIIIANIVLWLGIIGFVICLFTLTTTEEVKSSYIHGYHFQSETVFNPAGLLASISVLIWTVVTWAVLKVFATISLTLKDIKSEIKNK